MSFKTACVGLNRRPLHDLVHLVGTIGLAVVLACGCLSPAVATAGEEVKAAASKDAASKDATEELTDESLGTPETSDPAASAGAEKWANRTLLDTLKDGGWVGAIIIFLSMIAVGFMVEHFMTIRKTVLMPEPVVQELDELIAKGDVEGAIQACQATENYSLFSNVVLAGLQRYQGSEFGFAEYKAAVEEAGEDQTARLYRKTEVLGVIGSVAPMLGLLGTVTGMVRAFNVIAATGGMARPDQLASGISEALVTTIEGLVVGIPTMIAFTFFRSRIDSLIAEAGKRVEQVMMPLSRRKA